MALKLTTTVRGFTAEYYVRVIEPRPQKTIGAMSMIAAYYLTPGAAVGEAFETVGQFDVPYSLVGGNDYEQGYAYLKTLPAFSDAEDC